ncbi:HAD-IC family P-type ATPase [Candidatus Woesearchaeota archaeon]|nr:HAD-IC family P-type ATPase [Candidatus Woesearchaeota archaeon]
MDYYKISAEQVFKELDCTAKGLSDDDAHERQKEHGLNRLETKSKINPIKIFIDQFKSFIIYILLFAVVFALLTEHYIDSVIILAILIANALIGFFQELNAQRSLEALKKLTTIQANVYRDGHLLKVDSKDLVPGDVIYLEAGDKVPADCRIIEATRLKVEESALTGESVPADKDREVIANTVQIGDQSNMLFSSTTVVEGTVKAIVVATGMKTEIGKITHMLREVEQEMTPLQRRLDSFGKKLGIAVIIICIIVLLTHLTKGFLTTGTITIGDIMAFVFIAIALAVAAVPTGLPAVVTIALSIGVQRLLKQKALVKNLSSVETLGSCDVICTDKTGTLTKNEMTVEKACTLDGEATLIGSGYDPEGKVQGKIDPKLFTIGLICNNASLYKDDESSSWKITGDPTEGALLVSAKKAGLKECSLKRIDELPFDSSRKLMSVLIEEGKKLVCYTKGAPDQLLKRCTHAMKGGKKVKLTSAMQKEILKQNDDYSKKALRVLAFAYKDVKDKKSFTEKELVFVGMQAMIDPPRPDVIDSIAVAHGAGIRVIMITGDYKETAKAIANQIGIAGEVITGSDVEKMSDKQLEKALKENTNIFARVIPEHKQRIVAALQRLKYTVAMTGDGVNDAPALKKANIGIAVGSGTEVAKEASDFVLLDDSFTHIVHAVEQGRGIYDNIQKSIMLLLSGNVGEVLIIFLAALMGANLPLTAILLLWINMVTDGAPALAYSVDPYGDGIMKRKPKPHDEAILPRSKALLIFVLGVIGTTVALMMFYLFGGRSIIESNVIYAQTLVFNFVVIYEMILVFLIRKDYGVKFFSNKWIWFSVVGSLALQGVLMYTPAREWFKIVGMDLFGLGVLAVAGISFYCLSMIYYFIVHRKMHSTGPI